MVAALLLAGRLVAKDGATKPGPLMTELAESLVNEPFVAVLPKAWRGAMGTWVCEGGALRGTEVAANKHQAAIRRPLAFTNAIITSSFRLDGARQIRLSVNDAKEHVCRVLINPKRFIVQKDEHDHDSPDKAVIFARVPMILAPGEWHTAVVESVGAEMVAQIDGAAKVGFGAEALLHRPKANLGFTIAGSPAEFRDVTVGALKPRADWAAMK